MDARRSGERSPLISHLISVHLARSRALSSRPPTFFDVRRTVCGAYRLDRPGPGDGLRPRALKKERMLCGDEPRSSGEVRVDAAGAPAALVSERPVRERRACIIEPRFGRWIGMPRSIFSCDGSCPPRRAPVERGPNESPSQSVGACRPRRDLGAISARSRRDLGAISARSRDLRHDSLLDHLWQHVLARDHTNHLLAAVDHREMAHAELVEQPVDAPANIIT